METKAKKPKLSQENVGSNAPTTTEAKEPHKKRIRKRKRHIYNSIRQQMEFYFGDANLNKDRFMKKLIDEDPFVPLDIFLSFNKIKSLASSVEILAMALSNSELLELNDTNTKVRRKTDVKPDEDVDDRTIYVEALPDSVDHDWVTKMFSRFGKVVYVSLPKYAKSRKPKDFGFVEFQKEKSVTKAVKAFKTFNGVLSEEDADPAQLASVKSFNAENNSNEKQKNNLKRPLPEASDVAAKKLKMEKALEEIKSSDSSDSSSETSSKSDESGNEMKTDVDAGDTKKKRRKHKKSAEKRKKQLEMTTDASFYELKILPKRIWKRLRNKYLNLQREKTAELKRKIAKEKQQQLEKDNSTSATLVESNTQVSTKKSKQEERKLHKMKMNFYGAGADAEPPLKQLNTRQNSKTNIDSSKSSIKFESGLIVEISFGEPCVDIKDFKQQMRQHKTVKYVDVKEGAMEAFIRLETSAAAVDFAEVMNKAGRVCRVLKDKAEIEYWDKIERDRQMKLNKEIKLPPKRGREKVKASIAKHIVFNDDEIE